jgi:hypothetical protein
MLFSLNIYLRFIRYKFGLIKLTLIFRYLTLLNQNLIAFISYYRILIPSVLPSSSQQLSINCETSAVFPTAPCPATINYLYLKVSAAQIFDENNNPKSFEDSRNHSKFLQELELDCPEDQILLNL